jgi:Icc protein
VLIAHLSDRHMRPPGVLYQGLVDSNAMVLPGNHDDRETFRAAFADHSYLPATGPVHFAVADKGPVQVIGLDVTVPGEDYGEASDGACAWLAAELSKEPERPTIVMLHQPPAESGIACIDAYIKLPKIDAMVAVFC